MSQIQTDRNLLFGVLALQADLVDHSQFGEACSAWAGRKDVPLADLMVERGWLTPADRDDVERLLERKLRGHGSDVQTSLAAVATTTGARAILAAVDDADIQQSLSGLPAGGGRTGLSTVAYQPKGRNRYILTHLHATGGIGQVWRAHDSDLGRDVALKELRAELTDQPEQGIRFLEEARITGQLEHPGIVPVYELVGGAEGEAPFYTMRFIRGRTLSDAIKGYHRKRQSGTASTLDLRELLQVFINVCNAVAYAHSRGVIHRDLKGKNVVLGDFGEVMVLDWGLAKVLGQSEGDTPPLVLSRTESHGQTLQGQVLGTPAFMAPEQAEGRLDLVNQRSDIYSLGAILYEILTGQPPFVGPDVQNVLHQVIHGEPARPRALNSRLAPALEAICLKALAKRPGDRYPSAIALADETRHWLADEPVEVCRDPLLARFARWGRRHRSVVASAAALLLAVVVALAAGTVLLGRANAHIEQQREEAQRQRDLASRNFAKARQAVDDYFTQISENKLLKTPLPGMQPLRKDLLEAALRYYRGFAEEHRDDRDLQVELARAQYRTGEVIEVVGTMRDALKAYEESAALWEQVVHDHPAEPTFEWELTRCYVSMSRIKYLYLAQFEDARRWLDRALPINERLAKDHPDNLEFQAGLARCYGAFSSWMNSQGRAANEELPYDEKALAVWERIARLDRKYEYNLSVALMGLGYAYTRIGSADKALQTHERARALLEKRLQEKPGDHSLREELGRAFINLGYVHHYQTLRYDKGYAFYLETIRLWGQLARENPSVNQYQNSLASILNQCADLLQHAGQMAKSVPLLQSAVQTLERLRVLDPENRRNGNELYLAYGHLGHAAEASRKFDEAAQWYQKARLVAQKNADDQQENTDAQRNLARCHEFLAQLAANTGKPEEARQSILQAIAVLEKHATRRSQTSLYFQRDLAANYHLLGILEAKANHPDEALKAYGRSLQIQETVARVSPGNLRFQTSIIATLLEIGAIQRTAKAHAAALETLQKARAKAQGFSARSGGHAIWRRSLANIDLRMGALERDAGHYDQALSAIRAAIAILQELTTPLDSYNLGCARALAAAVMGQGKSSLTDAEQAQRKEEADQAVAALRRAIQAGFRDFENMKQDRDLDALRERPDFKKLLEGLEAAVNKKK